jgi:epoxyqueuosine reductase
MPAKVSRYAYGEDYHKVLRRKLKTLVREMQAAFGEFNARVFVDSGPVLERDWARRSGQGWMGKNTMLIHPRKGSYFFLAEIILDLEFDCDHPIRDHCGTCRRCIDACPTEAISPEGYILDGSKCISYLTIELKDAIPDVFAGKMDGWIFGCDICQEVCPWNRFSTPHTESAFLPAADVSGMKATDWLEMTEDIFSHRFGRTPLKRAGLEKLKETARFLDRSD